MREIGMTRMPTSMSATASDLRKKLVAFWSFFSRDTARITRMFPPTVSAMITRISSAGQFFSLITVLVTNLVVELSKPKLIAAALAPPLLPPVPNARVWLKSSGLLLAQTIWLPTSREGMVVPNPPRRALAGPAIPQKSSHCFKNWNSFLLISACLLAMHKALSGIPKHDLT